MADAGGLTVGQYFSDWLGSLGMSQLEAATVSCIARQRPDTSFPHSDP